MWFALRARPNEIFTRHVRQIALGSEWNRKGGQKGTAVDTVVVHRFEQTREQFLPRLSIIQRGEDTRVFRRKENTMMTKKKDLYRPLMLIFNVNSFESS